MHLLVIRLKRVADFCFPPKISDFGESITEISQIKQKVQKLKTIVSRTCHVHYESQYSSVQDDY
jgi:hypothetical protein